MAVALEVFVEGQPGVGAAGPSADDTFGRLYERYFWQLVGYCRRQLGNQADAEEVAQDALVQAWAAWDRYSPARPFWPWLATIARRLCIDHQRHLWRGHARRHAEATVCEQRSADPQEMLERREEAALALRAMRGLRPQHQRIIGMRDLDGWSYEEIAAFEGVTVDSVRAALRRAREALRVGYARVAAGAPIAVVLRQWRHARRRLAALAQPMPSNVLGAVSALPVGDALAGVFAVVLGLTAPAVAAPQQPVDRAALGAVARSGAGVAPVAAAGRPQVRDAAAAQPDGAVRVPVVAPGALAPEDATFTAVSASPRFSADHTLFATGVSRAGCPAASCAALFVSKDGGATWRQLRGAGYVGGDVLLPPAYPSDPRIFVAGPAALQVSTDAGASFRALTPLGGPAAISPGFSSNDRRILVGTIPSWQYDDAAKAVTPTDLKPPPTAITNTFAFAPAYPLDHRVLVGTTAATSSDPQASAVVVCTKGLCQGGVALTGSSGAPSLLPSARFAVDGVAWAWRGSSLYRTTDGAHSFVRLGLPAPATVGGIAQGQRGEVYLALYDANGGGGLYISRDQGMSWRELGLATALSRGVATVVALPYGRILAAPSAVAGGGLLCSTDDGGVWTARCDR